jgi:CheY-like chemotaxis protein
MNVDSKCILIVGFNGNDQWLLQRQWFNSGLRTPIRFGDDCTAMGILSAKDRMRWKAEVVLLEWKADETSGLEFLKWVRQQPHLREVILMVCSENCSDQRVKEAYAQGADCCVKKSADFAEVIQMLRRVENYWFSHPPLVQRAA